MNYKISFKKCDKSLLLVYLIHLMKVRTAERQENPRLSPKLPPATAKKVGKS